MIPRFLKRQKILQGAREEKSITFKGVTFKLTFEFSTEKMGATKQWNDDLPLSKRK